MKMIALKTFCSGGSKATYQGEEFEANERHAKEYVRLGLAEEVGGNTLDVEKAVRDQVTTPDIPKTDYSEQELLEKKATELKKIAKNIGVTGYSKLTNSELAFAILAQQKQNSLEG